MSASLRPRARRLISIDDEDGLAEPLPPPPPPQSGSLSSSSALQNAVSSAFAGARAQSPIPASHPSRSASGTRLAGSNPTSGPRSSPGRSTAGTFGLQIPSGGRAKSPSLWESSWAGLQGVASTLLGNSDVNVNTPTTPGGSKRRGGGPGNRDTHRRNYSLSVPQDPWGPSPLQDSPMTIDTLATGSREERLARVQVEKRKMLLAGVGDEARDAMGRYKRRNSLDQGNGLPSPTTVDDVLVYVHKVKAGDSVAGLSVRYNCTQAVVRKTNRLWANDTIQIRKIAYLPVDACSVRGQKIERPGLKNADLLAGVEEVPADQNANGDYHIGDSNTGSEQQTNDTEQDEAESQLRTHDSWVRLPSSPDPVEIARISRRALGWFPPPRRKSTGFHDEPDTTPPGSVVSRTPPTNTTPTITSSAHTSPNPRIRTTSPAAAARPLRPRTSRANSSASRLYPGNGASHLQSLFRGTGGVGSLHSNVRGPAPDELNRFVATHLPLLAIHDVDSNKSSNPKLHAHSRSAATVLGSAAPSGPRMSFDRLSVASGGSGSGNSVEAMAGAVEGWLRKAGGKVKGSLGTPEMRGRGRAGTEGDLIELMDGWELNGSPARTPRRDSWESQGHGVLDEAGAKVGGAKGGGKSKASASASASAREDEERLLRERFPPVGKVFEAGAGTR